MPQDARHARLDEMVVRLEQLPIEVAGAEGARVREDQRAHTGSGELVRNVPTQTAHPGDKRGRSLEFALGRFTKAGQPHLPFVNGALLGGQFGLLGTAWLTRRLCETEPNLGQRRGRDKPSSEIGSRREFPCDFAVWPGSSPSAHGRISRQF